MQAELNELKFTYNSISGKICLETYDEGFFKQEIDITSHVVDLVIEKLFNDMNCPPNGGVLELTRKFDKRTKIEKIIGQIITKKVN
ncbi:MAG: hypothetical protein A3F91_09440 [Flavobacteria bacterium RIFCSPLOWO2_12_FULL_35_11]|nr:MAG: hypothetical protein A3F91_09440 [Flavobacteria bacterium RIFCSPLOWO2_12_FULL_35_11]